MNIIWVMWSATTWPDQLARKLWSNQTCRFSFWEYPWKGSIFHGYSVWFVQLPKELNPQFHPSPGSANLSGLSFDGRWYRLHRAGRSHHWQCGLPVHPGARWVHQSTPPQLDAEWIAVSLWLEVLCLNHCTHCEIRTLFWNWVEALAVSSFTLHYVLTCINII